MEARNGDEKFPGDVDQHSALIDNPGRRYLHAALTTQSDPYRAIDDLQETFGLKFSCKIAVPFLDMLEVSRASLYQGLLEKSKGRLEDILQHASQQKLLEMLSATFRFITVKELKSIPIGVIKKLHKIPEKYLKALSSKKLLSIIEEIPLSVRRQVWLVEPSHFVKLVTEHSEHWIAAVADQDNFRRTQAQTIVEEIRVTIGDSPVLFKEFGRVCAEKVLKEKVLLWSVLLRQTIIRIDKDKIPALGKVRDLALQVEQCLRTQTVSAEIILNIINYTRDIARAADASRAQASHRVSSPPLSMTGPTRGQSYSQSKSPGTNTKPLAATSLLPTPQHSLQTRLKEALSVLRTLDSTAVFKKPAVEAFHSPQDKQFYLTQISQPMDLSTVQKKLHTYGSIEEFEIDLRLMLDNCMQFNGRGDAYYDYAEKLWKNYLKKRSSIFSGDIPAPPPSALKIKLKNLKRSVTAPPPSPPSTPTVPVAPPADDDNADQVGLAGTRRVPVSVPRSAVSAKPDYESSSAPNTSKDPVDLKLVLVNAWNFVSKCDDGEIFKEPVVNMVDDAAFIKQYLAVIKRPMDLSTIKDKLDQYQSLEEFEADVKLMLDNCKKFNEGTEYYDEAVRIMKKWKSEKKAILEGKEVPPPSSLRTAPVLGPLTSAEEALGDELDDLDTSLENAHLFMSQQDTLGLFAVPVTNTQCPEYSTVISSPMDLSTMQSKLVRYNSLAEFEADLKKMFDNCLTYHEPRRNYRISDWAVDLWHIWLENRANVLTGKEVGDSATIKKRKRLNADLDDDDDDDEDVDDGQDENYIENDPVKSKRTSSSRRAGQLNTAVAITTGRNDPMEEGDFDWDDEDDDQGGLRDEDEDCEEDEEDDFQSKTKKKTKTKKENSKTINKRARKSSSTSHGSSSGGGLSSREKLLRASRQSASSSAHKKSLARTSGGDPSKPFFPRPPMLHTLSISTARGPTHPPSSHSYTSTGIGGHHPHSHQKVPAPPTAGPHHQRPTPTAVDVLGQETSLWATVILRDEQLQNLVRKHLADRLVELCDNRKLPVDDDNAKNALELCQYGLHYQKRVVENVDGVLSRIVLPEVLLQYLDRKRLLSSAAAAPGDDSNKDDSVDNTKAVNDIIPNDILNFDRDLLKIFVGDMLQVMYQSGGRHTNMKLNK